MGKNQFHLKKAWPYLLIFCCCIAAYLVSTFLIRNRIEQKEIAYASDTASEVFMVWGLMDGNLSPQKLWPAGSFVKDKVLWTPLKPAERKFLTTLTLPAGTLFYYWMVQTKDAHGQATEIWDTSGP